MRKLISSRSANDKEFIWEYFPAGKNGGQHGNSNKTACRVVHIPSGAKGESREFRLQPQNKQAAFRRCVESPEYTRWNRIDASKRLGIKQPEEIVDEMMSNVNDFRFEIKNDKGRWVEAVLTPEGSILLND